MNSRRQTLLFSAVALLGLAGGLAAAWWKLDEAAEARRRADTLYTRSYKDTAGQEQALAQWRGRWLVVNFWATWCPPCIKEMPDLQKVADEYGDRGVSVVGLGIDNPDAIRAFQKQYSLRLPLLLAGFDGSELARELGNDSGALPYTLLIDPKGRIVETRLGLLDAAELRRWLDQRV